MDDGSQDLLRSLKNRLSRYPAQGPNHLNLTGVGLEFMIPNGHVPRGEGPVERDLREGAVILVVPEASRKLLRRKKPERRLPKP